MQLSESYADYHNDMNAEVFGMWFPNTLIPNLPNDIKIVVAVDNSKYHSRLAGKSPTISMKKNWYDFLHDKIPY